MALINYIPELEFPVESIKLLFLQRPTLGFSYEIGEKWYVVTRYEQVRITYFSLSKEISVQTDFSLKRKKEETQQFIQDHCFLDKRAFINSLNIKPVFGKYVYFDFYYSVTLTLVV